MNTKKLIVLSADALVSEDLALLETLPNYQKYLKGGCIVKNVRSVYPTITYVCHASMISGVWPDKHKIAGNLVFEPGNLTPDWKWFAKDNAWDSNILKAAKQSGYTTGAVYWPTLGNADYVDYLIDEYWTQGASDTIKDCYKRSGSNDKVLEIIDRHSKGVVLRQHPDSDEFAMQCAFDIVRELKPDVMFIHPANIDGLRHKTGLFTPQVNDEVARTDKWIGCLAQACKDAGTFENTNFVLTSDHGQMEIKRVVNVNVWFKDNNLIRTNRDGLFTDWDAYCLSGGMSGLVYLKNPEDKNLYNKVRNLLFDLRDQEVCGLSHVFERRDFKELHIDGDFSFVIESDNYTSFGDNWNRPLVTNFDDSDYRLGHATHGYLPHKGPQPVFICKGPDFNTGITLEKCNLVDEAPTYAKLLGIKLEDVDGKVLEGFVKS